MFYCLKFIGFSNPSRGENMFDKKNFFIDFSQLSSDMRKIFNSFLSNKNPVFSVSEKHWTPNVDIYETKNDIVIKMDLAGVKTDDLQINSEDNVLVVRGMRHNHSTKDVKHCLQMEINYGEFMKRLVIPDKYDVNRSKAQFKDGFLIIVIPNKKTTKIKN